MMLIINHQQQQQQQQSNSYCLQSVNNDNLVTANPADDSNNDGTEISNHHPHHHPNSNSNNNNNHQTNDTALLAGLGDYDVLCGRHKAAFNNTGNRRFRITVSLSLSCFMKATSRKEKNTVIKSILKIVQGNGGRFLEYDKKVGAFVELTTKKAHMKVGHALRDMALANRKELAVENSSDSSNNNSSHPTMNSVVAATTATTTTGAAASIHVLAANSVTMAAAAVVGGSAATMGSRKNTTQMDPNRVQNCQVQDDHAVAMDPWDLLESRIPATDGAAFDEGSLGSLPRQSPEDQQQDMTMLQWLIGESDVVLHDHLADDPEPMIDEDHLIINEQLLQPLQHAYYHHHQPLANLPPQHYQALPPVHSGTTASITFLPNSDNGNHHSYCAMDERDSNGDSSFRESIVLDDSLLQWLVGETNHLAADRFELV